MRFSSKLIVGIACILLSYFSSAQSNSIHNDVLRNYQQAIQFTQNQDYRQAYQFFELLSNMPIPENQVGQLGFFKQEATYYKAYLAGKLQLPEAEQNLLQLYDRTHDSRKSQLAYHLADFYFSKESYDQAEKWYETTSENALNEEWKDDYYFRSGYSFMEGKKEDKATKLLEKNLELKQSKYKSEAAYYLGVIYFNKKDYAKAEGYLQSIKSQDQTKGANFILAQIQFLKKNYLEVIKLLKNDNTESQGKNQLMGKSHFELNNFKDAEIYLARHLVESNKVSPEDMYQLAFSEYKNGNYSVAVDHFKELQLSNSFGQYAMYALADCYLKANNKQNALAAFQQASQQNQDPIITEESKFHVGKLNYDLKNYNQSTDNFFDFTTNYTNSKHDKEAWDLLTLSLLNTNNYPQVIGIIEKNPKIQEGNEVLYQEVCFTHAVNANNNGDTTTALKYLKKAILNPFDKALEAESRYLRAEIFYKGGQIEDATKEYNEVYRILIKEKILYAQNATLFNVHYGLGYCEYSKRDFDAALTQFINCSKNYIYSQNAPISNAMQDVDLRIADIYFMNKKYDEAYKQYSKISLRRGQGYDYATLQKANIDGIKKNFKDKITTLSKLMREVPNSIYFNDAQYQLGLAYEDDRNFDMAVQTYSDIINKSKSLEYIPKSLMRLATIYYNNQNLNEALNKYTTIVKSHINSPEVDPALKAIKEIYISQGKPDEYLTFTSTLPNSRHLGITEQDSLLFESGEELYANQNYDNAIVILNKYLEKFPQGIFSIKAHYLKAECFSAKKMYAEAIDEYENLTKENNHPYYERAVVKTAYFHYNNSKDYSKAKTLYQKLQAIASTVQNKQLAKIGILKSSYRLKNHLEVIEIAKLIEGDENISQDIKSEAIYFKAISLYHIQNYKTAIPILETLSKDKSSSKGAECTYYLASSYHHLKDYKKSNEILLKSKDEYGSYESWVVRYFILIGYNHHKLKDDFQAKATLESIINNYQGDEDILKEARERLAEINASIKSQSKVKYK
jgi:tetratricopeptide (TPR) repeat protein